MQKFQQLAKDAQTCKELLDLQRNDKLCTGSLNLQRTNKPPKGL